MIKFSGSRSYSLFSYWQLYRHHTSTWHADYTQASKGLNINYINVGILISPNPGCAKINLVNFFCNTLALALAIFFPGEISRYTVGDAESVEKFQKRLVSILVAGSRYTP